MSRSSPSRPRRSPNGIGVRAGIVLTISALVFVSNIAVALTTAALSRSELAVHDAWLAVAGVTLLIVGVTGFAIHHAVEHQLGPLDWLRAAMQKVGDRQSGVRLPEIGRSDFVLLATNFNAMAEALEQSRTADSAHATRLEQDIAARAIELEQANDRLRTLDSAKDALLSNVSHEMRTPLTSIIAASEILQRFTDDPETRREFLEIIDREAQRLLKIIESILDFAKFEADEISLHKSEIDLVSLTRDACDKLTNASAHRSVSLRSHLPTGPLRIDCDRERIRMVVEHLIDNAIKFSPIGGHVDVELHLERDQAVLRVKDEGFGVPPERRATLFGAFRQTGSVLTDKPDGVGLGLALSAGIVKAHGGTLNYEERDYRGACFAVRLPCHAAPKDGRGSSWQRSAARREPSAQA